MIAWLTIDFTARRYGCLPSELLKSGDTIDLKCSEIATGYEKWVKDNPGMYNRHSFSQDQLQAAMDRVRGKEEDA